jgi:hypothetical protein
MSFPVSPVNGQITTVNNTTYVYNSTNKSWTRSVGVSGTANVTTVNATTVNTTNGVFYSNGVVYGPNYTASTTTPANAKPNDRWYYTPTDTVYEYIFDGNNTQWVDVTGQTINNLGTANSVSGNLTVFGNIVPGANVTYTLGTPTARFSSLYLSGNTIDLGGAVMKTDATTGAIALIPLPTAANPNPTGIVVSPTGSISTVATTGGNLTANSISNASNVASASGTSLSNLVVANTVSLTTQLTTTAITTNTGTLNVGGNINYGPDYGLMASFVANIPNYAYVAAQNLNTGGNASTSFTAYNNTGTSYIDVGVNSSNFNAVSSGYVNNSVNAPSSSYVYSYGGDMVVGTWGNNGIHFITNATNTVGDSMFISGNGNVYISGNLTVSGNTTQINTITTILTEQANALQVSYITGNTATTGGVINVANPLSVANTVTASSFTAPVHGAATGANLSLQSNGTTNATLDVNGNFGLGVTPSAWSQGKVVEIGYTGNAFWGYSANQNFISQNAYYNGSTWKYTSTNPASFYTQNSGTHNWQIAPSGTSGNSATFTQAMTLDNSGNLGLGQTSITDGQGFGRVINITNGSTGGAIYLQTSTSTNYSWLGKYNSSTQLGDSGAAGLTFYTGNGSSSVAERMRIDASGNLGLGTTPSAWGSGRPAIEMSSSVAAYIANNNTGPLQLQNNSYYNGSTNVAKVTGAGCAYALYQGSHSWYSMASVSAGATQTFTQAMTLFNSGGLSLGNTTDPGGSNLSVNGTVIAGKFNSSTVYTGSGVSGTSSTLTLAARSMGFIQVFGIGAATERMTMYHFSNCGPTSVQASITQLNTQGFNLSFTIATVNDLGGFTVSWSGSNSASITVNVIYLGQTF